MIKYLTLVVILLFSFPVLAQQSEYQCYYTGPFYKMLSEKRGYERVRTRVVSPNMVFEVWENKETGAWLGMVTKANGSSCPIIWSHREEGEGI